MFSTKFLKEKLNLKIQLNGGEIFYVSYGLRPNADEKLAKGLFKKTDLIFDKKDKIHSKPYIEGKDIKSFQIERIRYLEWNTERCPKLIARPTFPELYISPKIVRGRMTDAIYDDKGLLSNDSTFISTFWHNLKAVQNRSINNSVAKDFGVKGKKQIAEKRIKLNEISQKFNIKYCLSILNSKFAKWFFNQVRRSAIGLYPNDIKQLPIKNIHFNNQKPFETLVDKIITKKEAGEDTAAEEQQIDIMVYKLYELTYDEVKIVDPEFALTENEYNKMRF